jgi:hypothetical protein
MIEVKSRQQERQTKESSGGDGNILRDGEVAAVKMAQTDPILHANTLADPRRRVDNYQDLGQCHYQGIRTVKRPGLPRLSNRAAGIPEAATAQGKAGLSAG